MDKLLIATTNPGKLKEYRLIFDEIGIETLSLADFPEMPDVAETGKTFDENALLKVAQYSELSGVPTVAEDGGFEIDILNGEPGIYSRRWISYDKARAEKDNTASGADYAEATDEELIQYTLARLEGVPQEKRTARLRLVAAFDDGADVHTSEASIEGVIIDGPPAIYKEGFPFRALLYIPRYNKMLSELTAEEHLEINHRRKAVKELLPIIEETLGLK